MHPKSHASGGRCSLSAAGAPGGRRSAFASQQGALPCPDAAAGGAVPSAGSPGPAAAPAGLPERCRGERAPRPPSLLPLAAAGSGGEQPAEPLRRWAAPPWLQSPGAAPSPGACPPPFSSPPAGPRATGRAPGAGGTYLSPCREGACLLGLPAESSWGRSAAGARGSFPARAGRGRPNPAHGGGELGAAGRARRPVASRVGLGRGAGASAPACSPQHNPLQPDREQGLQRLTCLAGLLSASSLAVSLRWSPCT